MCGYLHSSTTHAKGIRNLDILNGYKNYVKIRFKVVFNWQKQGKNFANYSN